MSLLLRQQLPLRMPLVQEGVSPLTKSLGVGHSLSKKLCVFTDKLGSLLL